LPFADTLHLSQVTVFLDAIALYIPNVIAAAIILTAGVILAGFIDGIITDALAVSKTARYSQTDDRKSCSLRY